MKKGSILLLTTLIMFVLTACDERALERIGGDIEGEPASWSSSEEENAPSGGGEEQRSSNQDEALTDCSDITAEQLWEEALAGCWTAAEGRFAYFTYLYGDPAFYGGRWEEPSLLRRGAGRVDGLKAHSAVEYTITVVYPPVPEGEAADEQETRELTQLVKVDLSYAEQDGKIHIQVGDDIDRQYAWGGASYDDAYDSVHTVECATYEEVSNLWGRIVGYWNGTDDRFAAFVWTEGGEPAFYEGIWNAGGGRGPGRFEKALSPIGQEIGDEVKLVFYYPSVGEEMIDGPQPELYQTVYLDLSGLDRDGGLRVKVGDGGDWLQVAPYEGEPPEDGWGDGALLPSIAKLEPRLSRKKLPGQ